MRLLGGDAYAGSTELLKSNFEGFWLDEINKIKLGDDGQDHNKLRLYKTFKGSFRVEPYIDMVPNRNQRCFLTRLRISAHHLCIETGRYSKPKPTPIQLIGLVNTVLTDQ